MWSAICFNLDQSKILSSDKGLRCGIKTVAAHNADNRLIRCCSGDFMSTRFLFGYMIGSSSEVL